MSEPATGIEMCSHCPLCETEIDPMDFHVLPKKGGGLNWTYECLGCGGIEKPTEEWVKMHREKIAKTLPN